MALAATCKTCGGDCKRHCAVSACPWVVCDKCGQKALTPEQRRRMDGHRA